MTVAFANRVTELLGVDIPIVQAPMGWIARAQLASAVSNAGAMGIIETSSGELDVIREEIRKMRDLTEKPFGVNIAQAFVRDPSIVEFVADQGVTFVTTSAGSPMKYTTPLKEAGLTVFHVVPNLAGALKAVDAGVDGLIVEGGEGGGFKSPRPVATMVLLPLVVSKVDVPVIVAGGFVDGATMAAALALGAEGVQLGTRMVSSAESPIHDNWKQAVLDAGETDTVFLNQHTSPALRALRTERTNALEFDRETNAMVLFGRAMDLYFGGDMEAAIVLSGQVAGRIDDIKPVAQIIEECARDCLATIGDLAERYPRGLIRAELTRVGGTAQRTHTDTNATVQPDRIGLLDIGRTVRDVLTGRELPSPLDAMASRTDDVVEWRFGSRRYFALRHPDHLEDVLVAGHDRYVKAAHYRLLAAVTGEGLLTNEGESWAHQRRLIQPLLGRRQLDGLGAYMTAAATAHVARWDAHEDGATIDVAAAMTELTLDVVGRALFGTTLANVADRLRPAVGMGMDTAVGAARLQSVLSLPPWFIDLAGRVVYRSPVLPRSVRRIQTAMRTIDDVVREIIAARRVSGSEDHSDMVGLLLAARDVDGRAMTETQVRDELVTFMLAGHETTATALGWLWYLLARHPDARARLFAEVDEVVGDREATAVDADALVWTTACVEEALRLYPPAWILEREATVDDEIDGRRIPAGSTLHLAVHSAHHDPRWWPDPERFDPERFLGEPVQRPRCAYLPFGAGRRACVGQSFALLEAILIAATVSQRYQLDLDDGTVVEPEATVTLRPKGGLPMQLHRRRR